MLRARAGRAAARSTRTPRSWEGSSPRPQRASSSSRSTGFRDIPAEPGEVRRVFDPRARRRSRGPARATRHASRSGRTSRRRSTRCWSSKDALLGRIFGSLSSSNAASTVHPREVLGEPAGELSAVDRLRRSAARRIRVGRPRPWCPRSRSRAGPRARRPSRRRHRARPIIHAHAPARGRTTQGARMLEAGSPAHRGGRSRADGCGASFQATRESKPAARRPSASGSCGRPRPLTAAAREGMPPVGYRCSTAQCCQPLCPRV